MEAAAATDFRAFTLGAGERLVVPPGWWHWVFSNESISIHAKLERFGDESGGGDAGGSDGVRMDSVGEDAGSSVKGQDQRLVPFSDRVPPPPSEVARLIAQTARAEGVLVASSATRFLPVHKESSPPYWQAVFTQATLEEAEYVRETSRRNTLFLSPMQCLRWCFWRAFGLTNTGLHRDTTYSVIHVLEGRKTVFVAPPESFEPAKLPPITSSGHEHLGVMTHDAQSCRQEPRK